MANGQDKAKKHPPKDMNNKDNDEIEKLSSIKERLECKRLQAETEKHQAETREHEKSFLIKPVFLGTALPIILAIAIFVGHGMYSGWFNVKQKRLENEKILLDANTITLKREKNILENQKNELELNTKKLEAEKTLLEEKYKTKNSELVKMLEDKKVKLEKEYDDRKVELVEQYEKKSQEMKEEHEKEILALKGEYTKLKEEVKSMSSFTNWYDKGVGEYVHKRYEEAISSFTTALSKKSDDASRAYALNYRGGIFVKILKDKEALADFEESITYRWDNPRPHYNMADIYLREGNIDKAKEKLEILNGLLDEGNLEGEEKTDAVIFIKLLKKELEKAEKKGD
jgi:tetratricopeptide (TPR) repeat protein